MCKLKLVCKMVHVNITISFFRRNRQRSSVRPVCIHPQHAENIDCKYRHNIWNFLLNHNVTGGNTEVQLRLAGSRRRHAHPGI